MQGSQIGGRLFAGGLLSEMSPPVLACLPVLTLPLGCHAGDSNLLESALKAQVQISSPANDLPRLVSIRFLGMQRKIDLSL